MALLTCTQQNQIEFRLQICTNYRDTLAHCTKPCDSLAARRAAPRPRFSNAASRTEAVDSAAAAARRLRSAASAAAPAAHAAAQERVSGRSPPRSSRIGLEGCSRSRCGASSSTAGGSTWVMGTGKYRRRHSSSPQASWGLLQLLLGLASLVTYAGGLEWHSLRCCGSHCSQCAAIVQVPRQSTITMHACWGQELGQQQTWRRAQPEWQTQWSSCRRRCSGMKLAAQHEQQQWCCLRIRTTSTAQVQLEVLS